MSAAQTIAHSTIRPVSNQELADDTCQKDIIDLLCVGRLLLVISLSRCLPCLLIRQPYASLIAYGKKRWEFRSYNVRKRGQIAIAASRGKPLETSDDNLNEAAAYFPRGMLLAWARLVESRPVTASDLRGIAKSSVKTRIEGSEFWTADSPIGEPMEDIRSLPSKWRGYAWELSNIRPIPEPIPLNNRPCSPWTTVVDRQHLV